VAPGGDHTRRGELAAVFQADHGRPPTAVEAIKLAQQGTLQTRGHKHKPRSLGQQRFAWRREAMPLIGGQADSAGLIPVTRSGCDPRCWAASANHSVRDLREPASSTARLSGVSTREMATRFAALTLAVGATSCTANAERAQIAAPPESQWQPIAESPLLPRSGAVAVWTGEEMVVYGGSTGPPCPPGAGCVGPSPDELARDGAAYDPDTDSWRSLADSPQSVAYATAEWTGTEMVLLVPQLPDGRQPAATLAYDPATDRWQQLDPPPDNWLTRGEWNGQQIVYWQSEESADRTDWSLDVATGTWAEIGDDPLGETFDRSYTWVGDRFIVTGLLISGVDNDESEQDVFHVAEYTPPSPQRPERWRSLPPSTVGFWDANWLFHDGVLINPSQDAVAMLGERAHPPPGGQLDLATGEWAPIPQIDATPAQVLAGCQLPMIGNAGDWVAGGGPVLVSVSPADTQLVPGCEDLVDPDVAVWAGEQLIVWGGPASDFRSNLNSGYAWIPSPPDGIGS